jgi:hypothetical protein
MILHTACIFLLLLTPVFKFISVILRYFLQFIVLQFASFLFHSFIKRVAQRLDFAAIVIPDPNE